MIFLHFTAEIGHDHLIHPPEGVVLTPGKAEVIVVPLTAESSTGRSPRTSLADWAEENAEAWGAAIDSSDVDSFTGRSF